MADDIKNIKLSTGCKIYPRNQYQLSDNMCNNNSGGEY